MGELSQNTNLASEFYVLSCLHRIGANALLTLGNKKSVDIVIEKNGRTITIDVKGIKAKHSNFPIDSWSKESETHFFVFVSFLGEIGNINCLPEVYVVPSTELNVERPELDGKTLIYRNPKGNRQVVQAGRLRKLKLHFLNNWEILR